MRAAVLVEQNSPLRVMDLEPQEIKAGQVFVKIEASGICGAQIGEITGAAGKDKYLPHLLGHEGCGRVIQIGEGVKTVDLGDKVVMHWRKGLGIDAEPAKYKSSNKLNVGSGPIATFASSSVVSENRVTKIPQDIPADIGALMGCAVTTGFGLINNEAKLKIGQSIAVAGVGGVGLNVIQGARLAGSGRTVAIDIHDEKLALAEEFGATEIIKNDGKCYGMAVDVFVDCTGNCSVIEQGFKMVKPGGKLILVGQPYMGADIVFSDARQHYCGKTVIDSQGGLTDPDKDINRYLQMYREGRFELSKMITHRFKLEDINEAIKTMRTGKAGRCMLEM